MSSTRLQHHEGPPRGRGHYAPDGSWWDESRQQRFTTTADEDHLEIEVEDYGGTSWLRSLATTLTGEHGTQQHRFVGVAHSSDPRWPTYTVVSGTFPIRPHQSLADLDERNAWSGEISDRYHELQQTLVELGWRPAGHGEHWWSARYTRPTLAAATAVPDS